jgi:hypothetical protein
VTGSGNPSDSGAVLEPLRASLARRMEALLLTFFLLVGSLGIGWLIWSVVEWRNGRTPSFRLLRLRVVSRSDGRPIGLGRSILRNGILCTVLLVPTILVGCVVAATFVMGASAPDLMVLRPITAPWDRLTGTDVVDERT